MAKENSVMSGLREFPSHVTIKTVTQGLVTGIAGWGFALMLYAYGNTCGWPAETVTSWIFACWGIGCINGIFLALKYKTPIAGAWSISGAAVAVSGVQAGLTLPQLCTGYLMAGIIVLILGLSGIITKIIKVIPMPIVMGMTAGCLFKFATNIIGYISEWATHASEGDNMILMGIAIAAVAVWAVFTKLKLTAVPPVLASLVVVIAGVLIFGLYDSSMLVGLKWSGPKVPGYSLKGLGNVFVSITLPLSMLVIGAENTQAVGVLQAQGYDPPVKAMTVISGIGGMITSIFGGHNANIAGPMTAMTSSPEAGPKEDRYAATVICMAFTSLVAIFASIIVPFLNTLPVNLIYIVAGLSLFGVILGSLQDAFKGDKFQLSAFVAFVVALSGVSFFSIGSAFWALFIGTVIAAIVETNDLKELLNRK